MNYTRWINCAWRYSEMDDAYLKAQIGIFTELLGKFCQLLDIDDSRIEVDFLALKEVITRVDMRELYFVVFHNGMQANEYKFVALFCFWLIKLHPLWVSYNTKDSPEMMRIFTDINEKFAVFLYAMILQQYNPQFFQQGKDLSKDYLQEMEYSFRYRDMSKEAMYLMVDPFYYMGLFQLARWEDNKTKI